MNLIATLTREAFNEACAALPQADADIIAETYPNLFSAYFTYNARAADARPAASPGPAKVREPKAVCVAPINKDALDAEVLAVLAKTPNVRGETIAATLNVDGAQVLRSLGRLVTAGKVYKDGERRAARYKVAAKVAEPEAAE